MSLEDYAEDKPIKTQYQVIIMCVYLKTMQYLFPYVKALIGLYGLRSKVVLSSLYVLVLIVLQDIILICAIRSFIGDWSFSQYHVYFTLSNHG